MSNASSAIKKCSKSDLCLCSLKIFSGNKTFLDYPTDDNKDIIYLQDENGTGVPFSIDLVSKCTKNKATCPAAVLYESKTLKVCKEFGPGIITQKLKYFDKNDHFGLFGKKMKFDIVAFFLAVLSGDMEMIPATEYQLKIGECQGGVPNDYHIFDTSGAPRSVKLGTIVCDRTIKVLPSYKSKINITLGINTKEEKSEIVGTEMRLSKLARTINVTGEIDVNGHKIKKEQLTEEVTNQIENFKTLTQAEDAMSAITNVFTDSAGAKGTVLESKIILPTVSASMEHAATLERTAENQFYFKRKITLGFAPLIGFTLNVNLLQAFLAYFTGTAFAEQINKKIEEIKAKFGDKAVADLTLKLTFSSSFDFSYTIESKPTKNAPATNDLTLNMSKIKIGIVAESFVQVGLKISIVEGLFKAGATVTADAYLELCKKGKNHIEGVFYHDGVVAKVFIEISYGKKKKRNLSQKSGYSQTSKNSTSSNTETLPAETTTWVIYEKLPKKISTYRIEIL